MGERETERAIGYMRHERSTTENNGEKKKRNTVCDFVVCDFVVVKRLFGGFFYDRAIMFSLQMWDISRQMASQLTDRLYGAVVYLCG